MSTTPNVMSEASRHSFVTKRIFGPSEEAEGRLMWEGCLEFERWKRLEGQEEVSRAGSAIAKRDSSLFEMVVRGSFVVSTEFESSGRRHLRCDARNLKHRSSSAGARVSKATFILSAGEEIVRSASVGLAMDANAEKSAPGESSRLTKGSCLQREVLSCIGNASRSTLGPFSRLVWVHHAWVHDTKHVVLRGGTSAESPRDWQQGHSC